MLSQWFVVYLLMQLLVHALRSYVRITSSLNNDMNWWLYRGNQGLWLLTDVLLPLTHWGRVTHICVDNLTIIGSDNGLLPGRRQAIIWTNVRILLIEPLGTNFSEILIEIITFPVKKIHFKMSSGNWRPFCLGLNESKIVSWWNCYIDRGLPNKVCD